MAEGSVMEGGVSEYDVEAITRGLIREYLARKGLTTALAAFESEAAPCDYVGTTNDLLHSVRLSKVHKQWKERGSCGSWFESRTPSTAPPASQESPRSPCSSY
jgi:hypothetical protein